MSQQIWFFAWLDLAVFGPLNSKDLDDHAHHITLTEAIYPQRPPCITMTFLISSMPTLPLLNHCHFIAWFTHCLSAHAGQSQAFHTQHTPSAHGWNIHCFPSPWPVLTCWRWTLVVCIPRLVSEREWRSLADCPASSWTDFLKSILRYGCLL